MNPQLPPQALNALRRAYDKLPRDHKGKVVRGEIRGLIAEFGITRHQLYRIVRNGQ